MAFIEDAWYLSILLRHSERRYLRRPVPEGELSRLRRMCEEFRPFEGARAELVADPPDDVFRGIVGSYGKVRNAPHYIAFVGDDRVPTADVALGYMGEGIILEATSLGLNTCWVAGFFRPDVVRKHIDVSNTESVKAVTPIGYAENEQDRIDGLRAGHNKPHRRRELSSLIIDGSLPPKEWMLKALEAARLAPSAINRQPWRFSVEKDSVTINEPISRNWVSRISYRLDCGIAMLHLELGALAAGVRGEWTLLEPPQVATYSIV
jgi:nitroreductase